MVKVKKGRICGIYIRCSSKDQSDKESLRYQENECRDYIKENKLALYKIYKDVISGSTRHNRRPGMTEMFKDIEDGLIDAVVVHVLDRLCRDIDASGEINLFLKDHKVTLYQTGNEYDETTYEGKTRKTMDRMMGQMELDKLRERTKLGRKSKLRHIGWAGGRVPFGYLIDNPEENKNVVPKINPEEIETVRLVYELYWDKRKSLKGVVKYLNEKKISAGQYNKTGKWSGGTVARILRDHKDKYYGTLMNNNESGNRWGKILEKEYPNYPRNEED